MSQMTEHETSIRIEALDRAVRVALAAGGHEADGSTVARAEEFYRFLNGG